MFMEYQMNRTSRRHESTIPVDHGQFYLLDASLMPDTRMIWDSDEANTNRVAVTHGLIAVSPGRIAGDTDVVIEIREDQPNENFDTWD